MICHAPKPVCPANCAKYMLSFIIMNRFIMKECYICDALTRHKKMPVAQVTTLTHYVA